MHPDGYGHDLVKLNKQLIQPLRIGIRGGLLRGIFPLLNENMKAVTARKVINMIISVWLGKH